MFSARARVEDTRALTEAILRAYATANLGRVAGGTRQRGGFEEAPFGIKGEPLGDSIRERVGAFDALRVWAIDAAPGLRTRGRFIKQAVDLVEVADAFGRGAFRRGLPRKCNASCVLPANSLSLLASRPYSQQQIQCLRKVW